MVPAKTIGAYFEHSTSRAMDPHFHGHVLLLSTVIRPDNTTGALHTKPLIDGDFKKAGGAFFRNALKRQLRQHLGVDARCTGFHLKIAGIPENVCRHFSKRRQEIEQYLNQRGLSSGKAAAIAALETRQAKTKIPPRPELIEQWRKEAAQFGLTPEKVLKLLYQIKPERQLAYSRARFEFRVQAVSFRIDLANLSPAYRSISYSGLRIVACCLTIRNTCRASTGLPFDVASLSAHSWGGDSSACCGSMAKSLGLARPLVVGWVRS